MSFNTIYYGSFNDNVNRDRIDIYIKQKDFGGVAEKLILDGNPLVISYPKHNFDDQLFGCGCKINVINNSNDFYRFDSLFSTPERNNYVEIIKTSDNLDSSIYLFQGYILPEMYTTTLEKNIKLTIPATDRLTTLDRYTPTLLTDTSTYRSDEYLNAFDLISNIISDTDVENKLAIHNTLYNSVYTQNLDDSSTYRCDTILFSGGGVGDGASIRVNGLTKWWAWDEFYGVQKGNQNFVANYDVSYLAVDVSVTYSGNNLIFKSTLLGIDFVSDTSVSISTNEWWTLSSIIQKTSDIQYVPNTVFNSTFLFADNFYNNETIQDDKVCLEKILKTFYSRCFYSNGKWCIERVSDMGRENKRYVYYQKGETTDRIDVSNNRINLSCPTHYMISGSPDITYNPGYQKLVVNLKFKEPESLVENYYYDVQNLDPAYQSPYFHLPIPEFRHWMTTTTTDASFEAYATTVPGIKNALYCSGAYKVWSTLANRESWIKRQFVSTPFYFTPITTTDGTIISLKYQRYINPAAYPGLDDSEQSDHNVCSYFSLRGVDENGKDWWVAKSKPDDASTYWSESLYKFLDASISWYEIGRNNYLLDCGGEINITSMLATDTIKANGRKHVGGWSWDDWQWHAWEWVYYTYDVPVKSKIVGNLYLDIYVAERLIPGFNYYSPWLSAFGNVNLDIKQTIPNDILEASMGYFYNTETKDLEIFDTSTVMFTNGLYSIDTNYNVNLISGWKDKAADSFISIQEKYIEDLSQVLSKPRYNFKIEIRSNDSSVFTMGNIYTHNRVKYLDGSLMEFICNGMDYNVKENAYKLELMEYSADDDWRVSIPIVPLDYFSLDDSTKTFNYYGVPSQTVNVSTNIDSWVISTSENWINYSSVGKVTTIDCSYNSGLDRDGSLYFVPDSLTATTKIISIHQDSSDVSSSNIGFDNLGNITLTGLGDYTVDISLKITTSTTVESYYGNSKDSSATAWYNLNTEPSAHVYAIVTACTSSGYDSSTFDYDINSLINSDTLYVDWVLGAWEEDYDGIKLPQINCEITDAVVTGTQSSITKTYPYLTVSYDYLGNVTIQKS